MSRSRTQNPPWWDPWMYSGGFTYGYPSYGYGWPWGYGGYTWPYTAFAGYPWYGYPGWGWGGWGWGWGANTSLASAATVTPTSGPVSVQKNYRARNPHQVRTRKYHPKLNRPISVGCGNDCDCECNQGVRRVA